MRVPERNTLRTVKESSESVWTVLVENGDDDVGATGRRIAPSEIVAVGGRKTGEGADVEDSSHIHDAWDDGIMACESGGVELRLGVDGRGPARRRRRSSAGSVRVVPVLAKLGESDVEEERCHCGAFW